MTNSGLTRRAALALLACAAATPAWAHRTARTETTVQLIRNNRIDVTHVYHLQDAQNALYAAGRIERPDLTSLRARAILALYTQETFSLIDHKGKVELEIIDSEIRGDNIYVYQQGWGAHFIQTIDAHMLRDMIPGQLNSVNIISAGGDVATLDFKGDDGPKPIEIAAFTP